MNPTIVPIPKLDVHKITSGQVIIDLSSAVKELIDNSIDAHATQIDIVFRNYGIDSIECSDNGDGISEDNLANLARKHYTSKISNFEDILKVQTLGFRGEALFSLCNVSNLTVIATIKPPVSRKVEYDHNGDIISNITTSRNRGTTVQINNMFENLPVRRRNYIKTIKTQFNKCVNLIQSYSIICEGIKFSVFNATAKGKKNLIFTTNGNETISKRLINVYGLSCFKGLCPINLSLSLDSLKEQMLERERKLASIYGNDSLNPMTSNSQEIDYKIKIEGYISKNSLGCGRNTKDRQHIYINKRPVLYPTLNKCFNDIFKLFCVDSNVRYPVFFINIAIDPRLTDVNITPDKRTVLFQYEELIMGLLKEHLAKFFDNQEFHVLKANGFGKRKPEETSQFLDTQDPSSPIYQDSIGPNTKKPRMESVTLSQESFADTVLENSSLREPGPDEEEEEEEEYEGTQTEVSSVMDFKKTDEDVKNFFYPSSQLEEDKELSDISRHENSKAVNSKDLRSFEFQDSQPNISGISPTINNNNDRVFCKDKTETVVVSVDGEKFEHKASVTDNNKLVFLDEPHIEGGEGEAEGGNLNDENLIREVYEDKEEALSDEGDENFAQLLPPVEVNIKDPFKYHWNNSLDGLQVERYRSLSAGTDTEHSQQSFIGSQIQPRIYELDLPIETGFLTMLKSTKRKVDMAFSDSSNNNGNDNDNSAERVMLENDDEEDVEEIVKQLTLAVKKEDFAKMKVVGQFNLGFIITTKTKDADQSSNKNSFDLFIIDQHASDEKFNFETLQRTTVLRSQRLVVPHTIELNVIDELIVMDNIEVFKKNGFRLEIEEEAPPGKRLKMLSIPVSKREVFNLNDFHELIGLIRENEGGDLSRLRCSKVRSMFAMRACRSSIMIGKPLVKRTMERVVNNLSTLDKPWNCPHGRPTMKHLLEVSHWNTFSADYSY